MSDQDQNTDFKIKKAIIRARLGKYTKKAYMMLPEIFKPYILDIGCGTGIPTIELAKLSNGYVVGMDISDSLLNEFLSNIDRCNFHGDIKALRGSIFKLPFKNEVFDILWAEGVIAIMDFNKGLIDWRSHIKTNGFLVLHDDNVNIDDKLKQIEDSGFVIINQFILSKEIWWQEYYGPMEKLLNEIDINKISSSIFDKEQREINVFKGNPEHFSSKFFILQKI